MLKLFGNFFMICEVFECYDVEVMCFFIVCMYYCLLFNYSDVYFDDVCVLFMCLYMVLKDVDVDMFVFDWNELYV